MDEHFQRIAPDYRKKPTGIEEEREHFARLQNELRRPLWKRVLGRR